MSARERGKFAEIAKALTGIKGKDAQNALRAVRGALKGQPMKDAQAELIGRVVAGATALGLYQSAKQPLAHTKPLKQAMTNGIIPN